MIYLKYYESIKDIDSICEKYNIKNYKINSDLTIDAHSNVDLSDLVIKSLPLNFRKVSGHFDCSGNILTSLYGCPEFVGGNFNCEKNKITSLEWGPKEVSGIFTCSMNKITSLIGSPEIVGGDFYCNNNKLKSLVGSPDTIKRNFNCSDNLLKSLKGPKRIRGNFDFTSNMITSLEELSSIEIYGRVFINLNPLPRPILDTLYSLRIGDITKDIIKWQNDYCIWNRDGTLNEENFKELLEDIK